MQIAIKSPTASPVRMLGRRLQFGLAAPIWYGGYCPSANWWDVSVFSGFGSTVTGGLGQGGEAAAIAAGYIDPDTLGLADPLPEGIEYFSRYILTTPDDRFDGEQFKITWDGSATAGLYGGGTGNVVDETTANSHTVTLGTGVGNTWIGIFPTDVNDPPRNIKVFQTRYENETVIDGITYPGINQGAIFNPHWLHQIKDARRLRVMDWLLTNHSTAENFSDFAPADAISWSQIRNGQQGSVTTTSWGGVPLERIADLVEATGVPELHFCIPAKATDACVTSLATWGRDNPKLANCKIIWELSNEPWNVGFQQFHDLAQAGTAFFGVDEGSGKYYGYRAAACMKIIRDVYGPGNANRWCGYIGTQSVNPDFTTQVKGGIDYWRANALSPANSLTIAELFNDGILGGTGYFTSAIVPWSVTGVTREANPTVTFGFHDFQVGDRIRFNFMPEDGMNELSWSDSNNVVATVTEWISYEQIKIDINTTGFTPLVGSPQRGSYAVTSGVFDLMEASIAAYDAGTTSSKYQYFSEQVAVATLAEDGTSADGLFKTGLYIPSMKAQEWPNQKALADAMGLKIGQYEAGSALCAVGGLTDRMHQNANDLADFLEEAILADGNTAASAKVFSAMFSAFAAMGTDIAAKFTADGQQSINGNWGGFTKLPTTKYPNGDLDNPVWKAVLAANKAYFAT